MAKKQLPLNCESHAVHSCSVPHMAHCFENKRWTKYFPKMLKKILVKKKSKRSQYFFSPSYWWLRKDDFFFFSTDSSANTFSRYFHLIWWQIKVEARSAIKNKYMWCLKKICVCLRVGVCLFSVFYHVDLHALIVTVHAQVINDL